MANTRGAGILPRSSAGRGCLTHVVNERHVRRRAMVFTTNKNPKPTWDSVVHDDDLAEAIVDRILQRGRVRRLDGPSVRTKHLPAEEAGGEHAGGDEVLRFSGKETSKPVPDAPDRA
ncbi:MAG: ATP-binding protein [Polyangiaceae bacterium]|nr:ATP-binding protein [Polyangiaceae bacterium]